MLYRVLSAPPLLTCERRDGRREQRQGSNCNGMQIALITGSSRNSHRERWPRYGRCNYYNLPGENTGPAKRYPLTREICAVIDRRPMWQIKRWFLRSLCFDTARSFYNTWNDSKISITYSVIFSILRAKQCTKIDNHFDHRCIWVERGVM